MCQNYSVLQQPIIEVVLQKIEKEFLNPRNLAALEKEMQRQLEPEADAAQLPVLRKKLVKLDQQIQQGAERLLEETDQALVPVLRGKLQEWQKARDLIETELRAIELPKLTNEEVNERIEEAMANLKGMHKQVHRLDRGSTCGSSWCRPLPA